MAKTIDTLIPDIYSVIEGKGGWDKTITEYLSKGIAKTAESRFKEPQAPRRYLSLSSVGSKCKRKTWYRINKPDLAKPLSPQLLGLFFYGDLLELLILALARAAGHDVQGEQDRVDVYGIKGHRDAVIDGVTIDVKSASRYGMTKFEKHALKEDDPYGYIWGYLTSVRSGGISTQQLGEHAKTYKDEEWVRPVVLMFLGSITPEDCLSKAVDKDPLRDKQIKSEAYFYIGHFYLIQNNKEKAKFYFKKCLESAEKQTFLKNASQLEIEKLEKENK